MSSKRKPYARVRQVLASRRGFTMLELALIVSIIGLLSLIGYANVLQFQDRAKRAACVQQQRGLHEASILYGMESDPGTGNINASQLWVAELVTQEMAECPSSEDNDFDDYQLLFINSELSLIGCDEEGPLHPYVP